jgi:hypothetical protein
MSHRAQAQALRPYEVHALDQLERELATTLRKTSWRRVLAVLLESCAVCEGSAPAMW